MPKAIIKAKVWGENQTMAIENIHETRIVQTHIRLGAFKPRE